MTLSVHPRPADQGPVEDRFDIRTVRCDGARANIRIRGRVDSDAAVVLSGVIESHLRAGRRFLRLHLGAVRELAPEALQVISSAHERLLTRRGTMILTGVGPELEAELRRATPASPLLLIAPTAAEAC